MNSRNDAQPERVNIPDADRLDPNPPAAALAIRPARSTVGYGRPPVHTRFKPGQSGNPLGRRKMTSDVSLALSIALDEHVSITDGTARKSVSKAKALLISLVNKALRGDMRALASVVRMGVKTGSIRPAPEPQKGGVLIMPKIFWDLSWPEQSREMDKEAARRDALHARGLPYRKHAGPPMAPPANSQSQKE